MGFWAHDTEEWVDRLSVLIRDRQLRKRMGEQGRERIEKDYSLQAMAPQLAKVLIDI
ncbi:MAG: glycosyltransferase [Desulfobacterales bacterium]|nr:glycosyltransferase [Desulfobacterales bacterium]